MKKNLLLVFAFVSLVISSCKKESTKDDTTTEVNTWTFTEGSKTFEGKLLIDANLNTYLQANNTYNLGILGFENTSGYLFNTVLSLADTTFTTKTYQSGIGGNEYLNAFYYMESAASIDNIYKSSNLDPGPVMTYTITSYDAVKEIVTITFSGKAQIDDNGNMATITNGRVTAKVEK